MFYSSLCGSQTRKLCEPANSSRNVKVEQKRPDHPRIGTCWLSHVEQLVIKCCQSVRILEHRVEASMDGFNSLSILGAYEQFGTNRVRKIKEKEQCWRSLLQEITLPISEIEDLLSCKKMRCGRKALLCLCKSKSRPQGSQKVSIILVDFFNL